MAKKPIAKKKKLKKTSASTFSAGAKSSPQSSTSLTKTIKEKNTTNSKPQTLTQNKSSLPKAQKTKTTPHQHPHQNQNQAKNKKTTAQLKTKAKNARLKAKTKAKIKERQRLSKIKQLGGVKLSTYILTTLSVFLLTIGLCLSWGYLWYQRTILSWRATPILQSEQLRRSEPAQIYFPRWAENEARINLVGLGINQDGLWEIPAESGQAAFLMTGARPFELGNTVIYGHNRPGIFQHLKELQVGDQLTVINHAGEQRDYQITTIVQVQPTAVEWIAPTNDEVLTIYTCIGFLDRDRLVIRATPTSP